MRTDDLDLYLDPVGFARRSLNFHPDQAQAAVLRSRSARGLLNCSRQWGKSTVVAVKAVHHAWFRPSSLTVVVSPSERQSAEFLRKASAFLRRLGVRPRGDGDNAVSLLLPNGARIVGLPGVESTVRGFSAVSLMLIDEAARVRDEQYLAVRPMLAVGPGDLWLLSTPHGRRGFFYEAWANGGPEWLRISVPATRCPRITPAFLEEERRTMGDRWFRQEYLCEFNDTEDSLFQAGLVEAAISTDVEPLFPAGGRK